MLQRYKNSPCIFQRTMNIVKDDLLKKCICYIDDILVFGPTEEEYKANFVLVQKKMSRIFFERKYIKKNSLR